MHEDNVFVTLTYDDAHLPHHGVLDKSDFQKFMKRLRRFFSARRISFFHCGEYGEENGRPHFHAILFNVGFDDRVRHSVNGRGEQLYESATLSRLWPFGMAVFGDVTFESAAYCARYCVKKVTGDSALSHYQRIDLVTGEVYQLPPEYATMSLKPGIGLRWFERYEDEIEDGDSVVMRGVEMLPPRYYDKKRNKSVFKRVKRKRLFGMYRKKDNLTPARLSVQERVKRAQLGFLKRSL